MRTSQDHRNWKTTLQSTNYPLGIQVSEENEVIPFIHRLEVRNNHSNSIPNNALFRAE